MTKCGWSECPDCKAGCKAFEEGDENVLTRNEELIIKPLADAPITKAATQLVVIKLRSQNLSKLHGDAQ